MEKTSSKSIEVREGHTSILIYALKKREGFAFRYAVAGGKPRTVERRRKEDAVEEARRIARGIESGRAQAGHLSAADAQSMVHAKSLLGADDPPLHSIVAEWKAAKQFLGPGGSVVEAARQWAERFAGHRGAPRTTAEVLAEMIASKQSGRRRYDPHTFRVMQRALEKFAAHVADRPITSILEADIEGYLSTLQVAPRTRFNVRTYIITLFRFARRRRYLAEDRVTEAEKVEKEHWVRKPPAIFTPDELRSYLAHVRPDFLPWMVLGAFAGIRTEEICGDDEDPAQEQLEWRDVIWEEAHIHIRAEVGKTDEGRIVPLSDNLLAWMLPWRHRRGLVCPRQAPYWRETNRLAAACGVKWRKNGLRHSHASYQYALDRDLSKLTAAMGNSARINRQYYQNPQLPRVAKEWFGIFPPQEASIIEAKFG